MEVTVRRFGHQIRGKVGHELGGIWIPKLILYETFAHVEGIAGGFLSLLRGGFGSLVLGIRRAGIEAPGDPRRQEDQCQAAAGCGFWISTSSYLCTTTGAGIRYGLNLAATFLAFGERHGGRP